jgi:hypothetical protein
MGSEGENRNYNCPVCCKHNLHKLKPIELLVSVVSLHC